MKKLILLSLMFGGMGIVDAYASAARSDINLKGGGVKTNDPWVDAAVAKAQNMEKDPLAHIENDEKLNAPRIKIYSVIGNGNGPSKFRYGEFQEYSEKLAKAALSVIKGLLTKYGITINEQDLGSTCDDKGKTLLSKLYLFYNAHTRKYITINPIIKIQGKKTAAISSAMTWWKGYEKGKVGTLYVYNSAHNGKRLLGDEKGEGTGDISFVLVKNEDALNNLKYRVYHNESYYKSYYNKVGNTVEEFLGASNDFDSYAASLVYDMAVLNKVSDVTSRSKNGHCFGTKVYKARYMDYLGAYNTKIGDYLFTQVTTAKDHSDPVYFYHKALTGGDHIVGFYIMKNSLFRGLKKSMDIVERGYTDDAHGKSYKLSQEVAARYKKEKGFTTSGKHLKIKLSIKKHDTNFTPFFVDEYSGVPIKVSDTKGMAFYVMRISNEVFNEMIKNSSDYKYEETHAQTIRQDMEKSRNYKASQKQAKDDNAMRAAEQKHRRDKVINKITTPFKKVGNSIKDIIR